MTAPVLVSPPASYPVTLEEAKRHLRIDHSDDDGTVAALIAAATGHLDGWTGILGRCLCEQEWGYSIFPFTRSIDLPLFPLVSLTKVTVIDSSGAETTLEESQYSAALGAMGAQLKISSSYNPPALAAVCVVAKYGYLTVPPPLKAALLLLIGHWFEHRDAVTESKVVTLPMAVDALIAPFRRIKP